MLLLLGLGCPNPNLQGGPKLFMNATIFLHLKQLLTWCTEDAILTIWYLLFDYHIAGGCKNVHVRGMQI